MLLLEELVDGLGESGGLEVVAQRDRGVVGLPRVAHVSQVGERERLRRRASLRGFGPGRRQQTSEGVDDAVVHPPGLQRALGGVDVVAPPVGQQEPDRAEEARQGWDVHGFDARHLRQRRGVHRTRSSIGDHGVLAWIAAALRGDGPDASQHGSVGHLPDPVRDVEHVEAQIGLEAITDRPDGGVRDRLRGCHRRSSSG